jgi:hypothetical protein
MPCGNIYAALELSEKGWPHFRVPPSAPVLLRDGLGPRQGGRFGQSFWLIRVDSTIFVTSRNSRPQKA